MYVHECCVLSAAQRSVVAACFVGTLRLSVHSLHLGFVASAAMVKTQKMEFDIDLPGLQPGYDYFDGEVEVYGLKGVRFEPDAIFTPDVVATMTELLVEGWRTGEKTGYWEAMTEEALKAGVAWKVHVPPQRCGVHPDNRGKYGVDGCQSQNLGKGILEVGWSSAKCSDCASVQAPPMPFLKAAQESNDKLVALSNGLIPPLSMLNSLSMGGGHTNTFLRQCLGNVIALHPELKDKHGRLSAAHLSIGRPQFKVALDKGLLFIEWHWQTPFFWPSLPLFAQGALNTVVASGQGELEIMLTLHGLAQSSNVKDANGKVNWKPLEECACQTKPACAPWVSSLSAYLEQNSGGPKGELIQDLADYAKAWSGDGKAPQRLIGGEFFNKVVSLNFGSGAKYPYIKTAIVEAQLASPPDKMQDNFCRLMIPSCLMELTRKDKRQLIDRAENMMTEARRMVNSFGLTTSDRIRLVGLLDVRLILHILKKGKEFEPTVFKSMDDIIKVGRPHTHAYIHTYTHIYIYIYVCMYSHTNGVRALNPLFRYPVFVLPPICCWGSLCLAHL